MKLAKFGLYHMTDHGADVDFPIGYVFSPYSLQRRIYLYFWNFSTGELPAQGQRFHRIWLLLVKS